MEETVLRTYLISKRRILITLLNIMPDDVMSKIKTQKVYRKGDGHKWLEQAQGLVLIVH